MLLFQMPAQLARVISMCNVRLAYTSLATGEILLIL
jgi:hypothetical protein